MLDSLLIPLLLAGMQMGVGLTDSYTTRMCFAEGERTGLHVYEANPLIVIPFGQQPSMAEFIVSDLASAAATFAVSYAMSKIPGVRRVRWLPQITMIAAHSWQSKWNYKLYSRLKKETHTP